MSRESTDLPIELVPLKLEDDPTTKFYRQLKVVSMLLGVPNEVFEGREGGAIVTMKDDHFTKRAKVR